MIGGSAVIPFSPTVSPTKISAIPAIVIISPDTPSGISIFDNQIVLYTLVILPFLVAPFVSITTTD